VVFDLPTALQAIKPTTFLVGFLFTILFHIALDRVNIRRAFDTIEHPLGQHLQALAHLLFFSLSPTMPIARSISADDEQVHALRRSLVWHMALLKTSERQSDSFILDFDRLGDTASSLGPQGALALVQAGYHERALSLRRWRALASCCELGIYPGHLAIQAFLFNDLHPKFAGGPSAKITAEERKAQAQLNFCAEAMLGAALNPEASNSASTSSPSPSPSPFSLANAGHLWLELVLANQQLATRAALHASQRHPAFDPMEAILRRLGSDPTSLRSNSRVLAPILAQVPGLDTRAPISAQLWFASSLAEMDPSHPLAAKILFDAQSLSPTTLCSGALEYSELFKPQTLDMLAARFSLEPTELLRAAMPHIERDLALALAELPTHDALDQHLTRLHHPTKTTMWALDLLAQPGFSPSQADSSRVAWGPLRDSAIMFGHWTAAAALPAPEDWPGLPSAAFAHGLGILLDGYSLPLVETQLAAGSAFSLATERLLYGLDNPAAHASQTRDHLANLRPRFYAFLPAAMDWVSHMGARAENSQINQHVRPGSHPPARARI
jgi:hypothetical protein